MDFTLDEEQQALREAVRGLVGSRYSDFENRRRTVASEPGFDEDLWQKLAGMGVLGLPFSEADGGMGAGPVEVGIVAEELGRVLAPEPFLAAVVLAGGLVAEVGSPEQRSTLLSALAGGESVLSFAHAEPGSRWESSASAVTATQTGAGWSLSGSKEPVPHGARADTLIVSAALPEGGTGLFVVAGDADGVTRAGSRTLDGGRSARIDFASAPAEALGEGGDATAAIARALAHTRVAAGNQAVGTMDSALRITTGYLTSRKQFGVTLNHFQSLTFRAADLYIALELTRSLVGWATMVAADAPDDVSEAAARASLQVAQAGRLIGHEAIQLHGGIGMTAEYSIGSHTAHLLALEQWLGTSGHHLSALANTVADHEGVDPLR